MCLSTVDVDFNSRVSTTTMADDGPADKEVAKGELMGRQRDPVGVARLAESLWYTLRLPCPGRVDSDREFVEPLAT